MMILNIKNLIMKIDDDEFYTLRIAAKGPMTVTAGDIICPTGVEVLNKDGNRAPGRRRHAGNGA